MKRSFLLTAHAMTAWCFLFSMSARAQQPDNRPLAIRKAALSGTRVATFDPVEVTVELSATYQNPFDPAQVSVDAEVRAPGGKLLTIPGFLYVPYGVQTKDRREQVTASGPADFRIRYTPVAAGKHQLTVRVTDRSGTVRSTPMELVATESKSPGFVRVARESPHYFAQDDGRSFFAVGENVCWSGHRTPVADYSAWFKGLGAAGGNWARLWLSNNEKGLEWMPQPTPRGGIGDYHGLGRYAMDSAWRLDEVVRLARENGVYLVFCLGTYGEFKDGGYFNEGSWVSNPYNARNGGPCAKPEEFWTNAEARRLYKQRLRYMIARWGYSPFVFAWEFWNEIPETPDEVAWVAEMAAYLKQQDPNQHMVSNTYGTAATWKCRDIDFTMTHMYGEAGRTANFTDRIVKDAHEAMAFEKPYLLAEFGIDWQTGDERWDRPRSGLNMHNAAWTAMMSGAAGTAMLWYWDSYVHPNKLYHVLTPVRTFSDTVDWARTRFRPLSGVRLEEKPGAGETFTDVEFPASLAWGKPSVNVYTVGRDGSLQGGPVAMTLGSPMRGNPGELGSEATWRLDLPHPTRIVARLGEVCTAARLQISVDGKPLIERPLTAGAPGKGPWKRAHRLEEWNVWVSDYDVEIAIDVPAGKHDVRFANMEGDWLQIRSLRIPQYRSSRYPKVDAVGLTSEKLLLLWLHNQESTWRTEYDRKTPALLQGLHVQVPVPAPTGTWKVEWWDTRTGKVIQADTVTTKDGTVRLTAPDFRSDLAARVKWTSP